MVTSFLWLPPFVFMVKAFRIFDFRGACEKGWVGRKYLEDSRFGNRLFNTGSGAVFRHF